MVPPLLFIYVAPVCYVSIHKTNPNTSRTSANNQQKRKKA
jgi:hypothetical protein